MRVVDVACGTGVLAIEAAHAVSPGRAVVGVDVNPGMLAVARRKAPEIDWHEAPAEALPLASDGFDAVVSQFGLMFFRDREAAVRERWRVLRPGGRLAIAAWDSLERAPGYPAVTSLLARLFGDAVAELLRAPYAPGDTEALRSFLPACGIEGPRVVRAAGEARFPSIRSWMHADVGGWTLSEELEDRQFERLVAEAERELAGFVAADGSVCFDHPALIATATRL